MEGVDPLDLKTVAPSTATEAKDAYGNTFESAFLLQKCC
ncbi:uncharacterized protein J3R85_020545 [Psidium guajava]|nr:uncharacterized protein J3R85_020545 [Psidium guajava]